MVKWSQKTFFVAIFTLEVHFYSLLFIFQESISRKSVRRETQRRVLLRLLNYHIENLMIHLFNVYYSALLPRLIFIVLSSDLNISIPF